MKGKKVTHVKKKKNMQIPPVQVSSPIICVSIKSHELAALKAESSRVRRRLNKEKY
jgi:hypothetical protein